MHRGYLLLGARVGLPSFLFYVVSLRRCWVSSFGGIFAPGAIAGNLPLSAVQHRADFCPPPRMNIISVAPCYVGLLWAFFGLVGGLLVWVVDPIFAPCLGHKMSGSLVFSSCLPLSGQSMKSSGANLLFEEAEN